MTIRSTFRGNINRIKFIQALAMGFGMLLLSSCGDSNLAIDSKKPVSSGESFSGFQLNPPFKIMAPQESLEFKSVGGKAPIQFSLLEGRGAVSVLGLFTAPLNGVGYSIVKAVDADGKEAYGTVEFRLPFSVKVEHPTIVIHKQTFFSVEGGKPPYNFEILSGGGTISNTGVFTAGPDPGIAVVKVSDEAGAAVQMNIQINPEFKIIPNPIDLTVNAQQIFTTTGGVLDTGFPRFYLIGGGGSVDEYGGLFLAPAIVGMSVVKALDSIGSVDVAIINAQSNLEINPPKLTLAKNTTFTFSAMGGTPPYTYAVTDSTHGAILSATGFYTAPGVAGTLATVTVTDAAGATSQAQVAVTESISLNVSNVVLAVNNTYDFTISGGISPYTTSTTCGSIFGTHYVAPNTPGTCHVTVTDSQSPAGNQAMATVIVNPALEISPKTLSLAVGESFSFGAVGGVPPYIYNVTSGGGQFVESKYTAPVNTSGGTTVTVQVTDARNNQSQGQVTLLEPLQILPTEKILITGESLQFTATGGRSPYTFSIVSGGIGSIEASGLFQAPQTTGSGFVRVTDQDGRNVTASVTVVEPLKVTPNPVTILKLSAVKLVPSGGLGPYIFNVSEGDGKVAADGWYTAPDKGGSAKVTVHDSLGTQVVVPITILEDLQITPPKVKLLTGTQQDFNITGGSAPFTYNLTTSGSATGSFDENSKNYQAPSSAPGADVALIVTDANGQSAMSIITIKEPAKVLSVSSSKPDGSYGAGILIPITVKWSEPVKMNGTLSLSLALDSGTKNATYFAGDGTDTFILNYEVKAGDNAADLNYSSSTALTGTVTDVEGFAAILTLPDVNSADSLGQQKNIVIDTLTPTSPSSLSLLNPTTSPGNTATPVVRVGGVANGLIVKVYKDNFCTLEAGSITSTSTNADVTTSTLAEGMHSFYAKAMDVAGNTSPCSTAKVDYEYDATAPTVLGVTSSLANGSYKAGKIVPVQVTFSEKVMVTGIPTLRLKLDSGPVDISYTSGTGTPNLVFNYVVGVSDNSADLNYEDSSSLVLAGAVIKDLGGNVASVLLPDVANATSLGGSKDLAIDTQTPAAPTTLSLINPASSPSTNKTPTVRVTGVANGESVALYTDSACGSGNQVASAVATGTSIDLTTSALSVGSSYNFYASTSDAAGNMSACSSATLSYQVLANPTKLVITTSSQILIAGTCSGVVTVQSKDAGNSIAPVLSDTTLSFSGGTATFYSTNDCSGTAMTSVLLPVGSSTQNFYFKEAKAGNVTLSISATGLTSATQNETIQAAAATQLVLKNSALTVTAGSCSAALQVETQDIYGNPSNVTMNTTLNVNGSPAEFYTASNCTGTAVTSFIINNGNHLANIYFKTTVVGSLPVDIGAAGFLPATQIESIVAGTASRLVFVSAPQTVGAGVCSGAVTIASQDAYGNAAAVAGNTNITITGSSLSFYNSSDCSGTASATMTLAAGNSSGSFYFKGTTANAVSVQVAASGFTGASQSNTVVPGAPDHLAFTTQPSGVVGSNSIFPRQPVVSVYDVFNNAVDNQTLDVSLSAKSDAGCANAATGTLSVTSNPVSTSTGVASFSGTSFDSDGVIYLKASVGSVSACSSGVIISSTSGSILAAAAANAPSDGLAEVTLVIIPKFNGAFMGPGKVVEVTTNTINVTLTGAGACRTVSSTCVKAVDHGQGAYTVTAKSNVVGAGQFTAVVAGTPDVSLPGSAMVAFNTSNFTVVSANTTITSAQASQNFYFTGGTATFDATTVGKSFGDVFVRGGTLTHPTGSTNKLDVQMASLTMMTGTITANALGYTSGASFSKPGSGSSYYPGGAHGGTGGVYNLETSGDTYGDYRNPTLAGGAGTRVSSAGGGVIRITSTGLCTINGSSLIQANGGSYGGAGGSIQLHCSGFAGNATNAGGVITANGGAASTSSGGGGGGRVALTSTSDNLMWLGSFLYPLGSSPLSSFKNAVKTLGGAKYSTVYTGGGAGTVFVKHSGLTYGDLIVDNGGQAVILGNTGLPATGQTILPSLAGTTGTVTGTSIPVTASYGNMGASYVNVYSNYVLRNLSNDNGTPDNWLDDPMVAISSNTSTALTVASSSGFSTGDAVRTLDILDHLDVANNGLLSSNGDILVLSGPMSNPTGNLDLNNGITKFNGLAASYPAVNLVTLSTASFEITGALIFKNLQVSGGALTVPQVTIDNNFSMSSGTVTTQTLNVSGQLLMSGGTLTHPSGPSYSLVASVGSFQMDGGSVNATGLGYGLGASFSKPGTGSSYYPGGSHGGTGGANNTDTSGDTYGDYRNPSLPGAGGTRTTFSTGGGVIRITSSGLCTINGSSTIQANGATSNGGAGGSVYLKCLGFTGNAVTAGGVITANGSAAGSSNCGGGGGRVALISTGDSSQWSGAFVYPLGASNLNTFKAAVKALGGAKYNTNYLGGGAGTVYVKHSGLTYGDLIVDNGGQAVSLGFTGLVGTGQTILPSIAGTAGTVTGTSIPVTASYGSMGANYVNVYSNYVLRNLSNDNGTPDNWLDDPMVTISSNTSTAMTVASSSGFNTGNSVRTLDVLDHLDVANNGLLSSNGDILVLSGPMNNPSGTMELSNGLTKFSGTASLSPVVNTLTISTATFELPGALKINNLQMSGGALNIPQITGDNNLTVSGGTLTTQVLNVGGQFLMSGGTLMHPSGPSYSLVASVGSFQMDGGSINVNGLGYTYGASFTKPSTTGSYSPGGSHGGTGGANNVDISGDTYGNYRDPSLPGGGGGRTSSTGGGVIRITSSGLCTINGSSTIQANGGNYGGAGGSVYLKCLGFAGNAASAGGVIAANGTAATTSNCGGGGGRVALISTGDSSQWSGSFAYPSGASDLNSFKTSVKAFGGAKYSTVYTGGGAGTVFVKHSGLTYGDLIVDNGGQAVSLGFTGLVGTGQTILPSIAGTAGTVTGTSIPVTASYGSMGANYVNVYSNYVLRNLSNDNGTPDNWLDDPMVTISSNTSTAMTVASSSGFSTGDAVRTLDILDHLDVANNASLVSNGDILVLSGPMSNPSGVLSLTDGVVTFKGSASLSPLIETLTYMSGSYVLLTPLAAKNVIFNGGTVTSSSLSVANNMQIASGTVSTQNLSVGGQLLMSGGTLTHPSGSSYSLVATVGSLQMDGGSIDVTGLGYTQGTSFTKPSVGGSYRPGGSHGGTGGSYGVETPGDTYGDYRNPSLPGGGGTYSVSPAGGGVVRITSTGLCTINGSSTIQANGGSGGGAGGSVYLKCLGFAGNAASAGGVIAANGTAATNSNCGGGGGRIALISTGDSSQWSGSFAYPSGASNLSGFKSAVRALGGITYNSVHPGGGAGTVFVKHSGLTYGDLIIDNGGTTFITGLGKTVMVSSTANSSTVYSGVSATELKIASTGTPFASMVDRFKGLTLHVFPTASSVDPLDISHTAAVLTSNTTTNLLASAASFPAIANNYYYRFVYELDHLDLDGKAQVDFAGADLILRTSGAEACDLHSVTNGYLVVPTGSALTVNSISSATCSQAGLGTSTGTVTTTNNFLVP